MLGTLTLLTGLLVFAGVSTGAVPTATASERTAILADDTEVTRNEAGYEFAREMSFRLEAVAERPVADVLLHYTIGGDGPRNRRIPEYQPGRTIQATHRESLARGQIPPASEITWWWTLTSLEGGVTETEPRTFRYLDRRFDWQSTAGHDVRVWWYDAPASFADDLEGQARAAVVELAATVGAAPEPTIHIVTYQSREDMRDALVDRGSTFEARLTTLGSRVAPDILLLLAGDDNRELHDVLRHELSHIVLHLRLGREYVTAPAWLDEGLAMYVEGELAPEEDQRLRQALRADELMSLQSLTTFPGRAELVPLAYAQSRDVVDWLQQKWGQAAFGELLEALSSGQYDIDAALRLVYSADQQALYEAYRADRGLAPPKTPEPGQSSRPRSSRGPSLAGLAPLQVLCGASVLSLMALGLLSAFLWLLARRPRGSRQAIGAVIDAPGDAPDG